MTYEFNSLSSSLMFGTTLYRNQSGVPPKILGQASYALVIVIAAVETIAASALSTLSFIVYPLSSTPFQRCTKWLDSSAFTVGWAIANSFFNLFVSKLIADEKSVRKMYKKGDLTGISTGAVY